MADRASSPASSAPTDDVHPTDCQAYCTVCRRVLILFYRLDMTPAPAAKEPVCRGCKEAPGP